MSLDAVIDISHFTPVSDIEAVVADGIRGIIHKCTQGAGYVDPSYASTKPEAESAGILWGAYHFGVGGVSGKDQVRHFLDNAEAGSQTLLALDWEPNTTAGESTMSLQEAEEFVSAVNDETGRYPGLYGSSSFLEEHLSSPSDTLRNCWLWVANYGSSPTFPPTWDIWTMWQYTEDGEVSGIEGGCDRDKFNGDSYRLSALWNGT